MFDALTNHLVCLRLEMDRPTTIVPLFIGFVEVDIGLALLAMFPVH